MSQRCPGKYRVALISRLTRTLLLNAAFVLLVGCSIAELERVATEGGSFDDKQPIVSPAEAGANPLQSGSGLLVVESVIARGQQDVRGATGQFRRLAVGAVEEVILRQPVAVGGVDNILYIVDATLKIVFQYDLTAKLFRPIREVAEHFTGDPGSIYVAKDHSFYIVDTLGKQVLHFAEDGSLLTRFQDLANLARPMDVTVDELTGNVFVADGSFSHVVVFNSFGKATRLLGRRGTGSGRFRAITTLAVGSDGLYIFDRLEMPPVQVLTWDGTFRYAFGEDALIYPIAAAVDRDQRVYVSDQSDDTLRIFQDGNLLMTFGGGGSSPGRFRTASGLWVNGDRLYVADSLNRRVQVLRINPNAAMPAVNGR
ncbi:hypothetical protein MNBD_GAMMA20-23 [hydrothermal vent metagenome]|uniref:NHL repeat domain protein n=1 Tax=hydrothermal vent metagenome TaxID=652676 RepID=A0A3B1A0G2_9ZZZZ